MGEFGSIISGANSTKFLGLIIQNDITWDGPIKVINKKLNSACYMIRNVKQIVSEKTLKSVYFSYFHSVMTYGIMFWGNSSHAERVFKLQKRVIRIMKGCGLRDSCRKHFRDLSILPLRSQYIYSLMIFVVKNREMFDTNKLLYEINTRHNMDIHVNQVNLAIYGKGVHHMAGRIYNALPDTLKEISKNIEQFKHNLKEFLYFNSFYTLDEFFMR
jgi:hypothetical protein